MEVAGRSKVVATGTGTKNQAQDQILEPDGIHPLLIPLVIRTVLESRRLSVDDLKTCRFVCGDWSTQAKTVLSKKCRITIKGPSERKKFTETFIPGQDIPSRDFKLVEYDCDGCIEDFMTHFCPLFDWPRLEIESLILNNCLKCPDEEETSMCYDRIEKFLDALSLLLKRTGNLKHLTFQNWAFKFEFYENINDLKEVVANGSKIKSLSLNNCFLPDAAATILLPAFNAAFPKLETIDFSNPYHSKNYNFWTEILPETLVTVSTWSNIKTLKIPSLNTEVIDGFNQTNMKLKHFHADELWLWRTSSAAWTEFLIKQNELESFSINSFENEFCGSELEVILYRIPRMEKLRRLHIGGYGFEYCILEQHKIFETCPNLNELSAGWLPEDMVFTTHQITSLTLGALGVWYCDWLGDLTRISKKYVGLKYLTVKLYGRLDRDTVKNSLLNIFPNLLELKVIP